MRLGVLLDPLATLSPYKDTSIAMIKSAQARNWSCAYFTAKDMFCYDGKVFANVTEIYINDVNQTNWYSSNALGECNLAEFDIILMRKDPPFDLEYIYATYALELLSAQGVLIANNPQSLRDVSEKFYTMHFPQCCPPTLISRNISKLKQFWQQHKKVVFKPLNAMGGRSVFTVDESGLNLTVILEELTKGETVSIVAQKFLEEITISGDKRILLINGEPIPYALARIPCAGESRGNLAAGARGEVIALTQRDYWICQQLTKKLQEKKLYFVGIDVIGDYLTEINVTSPTCAVEISKVSGIDISANYLDFLIEERVLTA